MTTPNDEKTAQTFVDGMGLLAQVEYDKTTRYIESKDGVVPDWDSFLLGYRLGFMKSAAARREASSAQQEAT